MKTTRTQNLITIALACMVVFMTTKAQAADPLASWNDGPAKQAIVEFVKATTTQGSPQFVPPEERVATFDQDGTLWVEHPMYTQVVYCLEKVPALVKAKPELAKVAPFSTVLEVLHGDRAAMEKLTMDDLMKILAATLTGMSVSEFSAEAKKWLTEAKDPRWKKPYSELTYLPMQEVLKYLRATGYKTYIVTGGGQDFVRQYAEATYGIPPEQIVGSAGEHEVWLRQGGQTVSDEGTENVAQRQQCRQARRHPPYDRPPAATLRSATRPATSRCSNTPRPAAARGSRCSCCTTMRNANTRTVPLKGCPTRKSARSRRRSMTRRRRTAGRSSA